MRTITKTVNPFVPNMQEVKKKSKFLMLLDPLLLLPFEMGDLVELS